MCPCYPRSVAPQVHPSARLEDIKEGKKQTSWLFPPHAGPFFKSSGLRVLLAMPITYSLIQLVLGSIPGGNGENRGSTLPLYY